MISASPELEHMKAEARPGTCMGCDGALPQSRTKRRKICRLPECARLYGAVHALGRRTGTTTLLRRIVARTNVTVSGRARVRLSLECGHAELASPWTDRRGLSRRYCAACAEGRSVRCH